MRAPARITTVALLTAVAALAPATAQAPAQEVPARVVASPSVVVPAAVELPITPVEVRAIPAKAAPKGLIADIAEERRWMSPVEGPRLTSGYGPRVHPISGAVHEHRGIDLAAPIGTPIRAPHRATVVETGGCQSGCMHPTYGISGYYVVLEHPDGVRTTYNHLLSAGEVTVGQAVEAGQVIGHIGMSGQTTGPHLHFQVLVDGDVDGDFVDPEPFFAAQEGVSLR